MGIFSFRLSGITAFWTLLGMVGISATGFSQIEFTTASDTGIRDYITPRSTSADFDGDGDLDLVVIGRVDSSSDRYFVLYLNDGAGHFSMVYNNGVSTPSTGEIYSVDIDGDQDVDMFVTGLEGNYGSAKLYRNNGAGNFFWVTGNLFPQMISGDQLFFDFNGDGKLDILFAGNDNNYLGIAKVFIYVSLGRYIEDTSYNFPGVQYAAVDVADVDGDNDKDLLITGLTAGNVSIASLYINNEGSFVKSNDTPFTGIHRGDVKFADVDNDGDNDVLLAGRNDLMVREVELYINDGAGNFTEDTRSSLSTNLNSVVKFADFNNDDAPDVFIHGSSGVPVLYVNDGTGYFTKNEQIAFPAINSPTFEIGDFNGDNLLDLFLSGSTMYRLTSTLYLNTTVVNKPPVATNPSITGAMITGQELTATYDFDDPDMDFDQSIFSWYRSDDLSGANSTKILEAEELNYTLEEMDEQYYISFEITPFDGSLVGSTTQSQWYGPVLPALPEIEVLGNSSSILDGSLVPSEDNHTFFEDTFLQETLTRTFVVKNGGTAPLHLENISILGLNAGNFNVSPLVVSEVVAVNEEFPFSVIFNPSEEGILTAQVVITNNDLDESSFSFAISGRGVNIPPVFITSGTTEFPENSTEPVLDVQANNGNGGGVDEEITYTLSGGEDYELFHINSLTGIVSFIDAPDFEAPEDKDLDNIYKIDITADDGKTADNLTTQSVEIQVRNLDELPEAVCVGNFIVELDEVGRASITPEELDNGSSDDSGIVELEIDVLEFSCSELGANEVWLTVTDGNGNSSSCKVVVFVSDLKIPVMDPPGSISVVNLNGTCGAFINIAAPTVSDNCGTGIPIGIRNDGMGLEEKFPIGSTTISWTVKDVNSNESEAVFQEIIVLDTELPEVSPVAAISVDNDNGKCGAYIDIPIPTAKDNCATENPVGIRNDGLGLEEEFPIGSTTITWTVKDVNNNESEAVLQEITVLDTEFPKISPVAAISVENDNGKCGAFIDIPIPTATDNCATENPIAIRNDGLGLEEEFPIGSTIISWTVKDVNNNESEAVLQEITVLDTELPQISQVSSISVENDNGKCGAFIDIPIPTATDNCGTKNPVGIRNDGLGLEEEFPIGSTTITWTVKDVNNNESEAVLQEIIVLDTELPQISPVAAISVRSQEGICGAFIEIPLPLFSDNCDAGVIVGKRSDGQSLNAVFPLGNTEITWTAIDTYLKESLPVVQEISVTNNLPTEVIFTAEGAPQEIGTPILIQASFVDENIAKLSWQAFNGSEIVQEFLVEEASGNSSEHIFNDLPAGVYSIILNLEDHCGQVVTEIFEYVVIYDPNGGFVTGGGWIESPSGAYMADVNLEGKANFGFNAKYKNGKNVTEVGGNTSFQFRAGGVDFKSSSHEDLSLVISGGFKATYKGSGSVNGIPGHKFMLTVIDADKTANFGTDLFRIKIWNDNKIIYDNNIKDSNKSDNADPATAISGGSIVIHKPQGSNKTVIGEESTITAEIEEVVESLTAYPNPLDREAMISFSLNSDTNAVLKIYDYNGREVAVLFNGEAEQRKVYTLTFDRRNLMPGVYIYSLITEGGKRFNKQLILK